MKVTERTHAERFRRQGLSYSEILERVPVSQSSLSLWLRQIPLTEEQKARIHGKDLESRRRFVEYNQRKRQAALARHEAWREAARAEAVPISGELLKWIGAALYWAEGSKGSSSGGGMVSFANSDPGMVQLIMRWFREVCKVPEEKFRIKVQLHPGQSVEEAEAFWAQVTGIPEEQFHRAYVKTSPTSQRKRGNILPFGVVQVRFGSAELFHRILGWIEGLKAPSYSGLVRGVLSAETRVRLPLGSL